MVVGLPGYILISFPFMHHDAWRVRTLNSLWWELLSSWTLGSISFCHHRVPLFSSQGMVPLRNTRICDIRFLILINKSLSKQHNCHCQIVMSHCVLYQRETLYKTISKLVSLVIHLPHLSSNLNMPSQKDVSIFFIFQPPFFSRAMLDSEEAT